MKPHNRILATLTRQPWLIAPELLRDLRSIAERVHAPDIEAMTAKRRQQPEAETIVRGSVAIIPVIGPIFRYANLFTEISGATSIEVLTQELKQALANDKVKSITLDIDSPGGQVTGISEFAQMIRASKKPVTAFVGGMAASAAYWIASASSRIVMADTAQVGSVGVVASFVIDDDSTVVEVVSSQSPHKRLDVRTDEGKDVAQRHVDELAQIFVDAVAENRGVTPEKVITDFGRGSVVIGRTAVRAGMADAIGSLEGIIAQLHGEVTAEAQRMPAPTLMQLVSLHGLDGAARIISERQRAVPS